MNKKDERHQLKLFSCEPLMPISIAIKKIISKNFQK